MLRFLLDGDAAVLLLGGDVVLLGAVLVCCFSARVGADIIAFLLVRHRLIVKREPRGYGLESSMCAWVLGSPW